MQVRINGKQEELEATSLGALLESKEIAPQMVTVELNGKMIDRAELADTLLHEADEIELLYFMGGGSPLSS